MKVGGIPVDHIVAGANNTANQNQQNSSANNAERWSLVNPGEYNIRYNFVPKLEVFDALLTYTFFMSLVFLGAYIAKKYFAYWDKK